MLPVAQAYAYPGCFTEEHAQERAETDPCIPSARDFYPLEQSLPSEDEEEEAPVELLLQRSDSEEGAVSPPTTSFRPPLSGDRQKHLHPRHQRQQ